MALARGCDIYSFFEDDNWPSNFYWESGDSEIQLYDENTGANLLDPAGLYDLSKLGYLVDDHNPEITQDFEVAYNHWASGRYTTTLVIEVPVDKLEAAKKSLKDLGFKVK